jgi:hypothetical protein
MRYMTCALAIAGLVAATGCAGFEFGVGLNAGVAGVERGVGPMFTGTVLFGGAAGKDGGGAIGIGGSVDQTDFDKENQMSVGGLTGAFVAPGGDGFMLHAGGEIGVAQIKSGKEKDTGFGIGLYGGVGFGNGKALVSIGPHLMAMAGPGGLAVGAQIRLFLLHCAAGPCG